MTEAEAREAVRATGLLLLEKGLVAGTWGNVSLRFSETEMAITPTGSDYRALRAEEVAVVDLVTGESRGGRPSSERLMHEAIYAARPELLAVVHTHSLGASTAAAARREVPPVLDELAQIVGPSLRVARYALPGTRALARAVVRAMAGRTAALMANHGLVAAGRGLEEALLCAEVAEKGCRAFIEASFLGGAKAINPIEARLMHEVYLRKYSKGKGER